MALPKLQVNARDVDPPDLKVLRDAIPVHCFQPSLLKSCSYVVRDLALSAFLFYTAVRAIEIDNTYLRCAYYTAYGFLQGLIFTGIWILAHECGHHSFSVHKKVNSCIGFVLHSIVMVPFFSWKFTHSRHHRYANHMDKDTVFVPPRQDEYRSTLFMGSFLGSAEDAPIISLILLIFHQLLGWPLYMGLNAGAGLRSLARDKPSPRMWQCHLIPNSPVYTASEVPFVLMSDLGLVLVLFGLWKASTILGVYNILCIYGLPYLWMNHWLVAITYLHHTHPEVSHYEDASWTFQKGALSTVDRDFGFIGKHMFHGIIEYHVVHHMFSRIPFYHAEEATIAIAPLLGKSYVRQKSSFVYDLWSTFTSCAYVKADEKLEGHMKWTAAGSSISN